MARRKSDRLNAVRSRTQLAAMAFATVMAWTLTSGASADQAPLVADLPDRAMFQADRSGAVAVGGDAVLRARARLNLNDDSNRILVAYTFSSADSSVAGAAAGGATPSVGWALYETAPDQTQPERIADQMITIPAGGLPHGIDTVRWFRRADDIVLRIAGPSLSLSLDDRSLTRGQTLITFPVPGPAPGRDGPISSVTLPSEARLCPGLPLGDFRLAGDRNCPTMTLSVLGTPPSAGDTVHWSVVTTIAGDLPGDTGSAPITGAPMTDVPARAEPRPLVSVAMTMDPTTGHLAATDDAGREMLSRLAGVIDDDALDGAGIVLPGLFMLGETMAVLRAPEQATGVLGRMTAPGETTETAADEPTQSPEVDSSNPAQTVDGSPRPDIAALPGPVTAYSPPRQKTVCDRLTDSGADLTATILREGRLTDWLGQVTHVGAADPMGRTRVTMNLCPGAIRAVAVPVEITAADAAFILARPHVGLSRFTGVPTARSTDPGLVIRAQAIREANTDAPTS